MKNKYNGLELYEGHDRTICLDFPEILDVLHGIYMRMNKEGLEIKNCYTHNYHPEYIIGVDLI